jgi:hypothetical protein
MKKIIKISLPEYRKLHVEFEVGTAGDIQINDTFIGVAQTLTDPRCFAKAKIIDDGYAIRFDDCEYSICSCCIYDKVSPALSNVSAM